MPVVLVLGNHDCYGNTIDNALATARKLTEGTRIAVLENETKVFGDLRVVGATLWTDFEIEWGIEEEVSLPDRRVMAIDVCKRCMVDFREIFRSDWHETGMPGLLMARELITRHVASRSFIQAQLAQPFNGTTSCSRTMRHHQNLWIRSFMGKKPTRHLRRISHRQSRMESQTYGSMATSTASSTITRAVPGLSAPRADIHTSERKMVSKRVLSSISSQTESDAHRQRGEKMFSAVIASIPAVHSVDTSM